MSNSTVRIAILASGLAGIVGGALFYWPFYVPSPVNHFLCPVCAYDADALAPFLAVLNAVLFSVLAWLALWAGRKLIR